MIKIKLMGILFLASIILVSSIYAIPLPHGVDGVVYELDGVTQVRKGIDFYVHNLNNGQIVAGRTGYGSSGRYAVSLKGNDGDAITVRAWNKYNQANATLTLIGVMRNVNLFLNMSFPPLAPSIVSNPATNSMEAQIYTYLVEAFDENEDMLEYSLLKNPFGMSINTSTGLITWMPLQQDVGLHEVIVGVSDGIFISNQSYSVYVHNVNDKPVINSTPVAEAKVGKVYTYDADAYDIDNDVLAYFLITVPDGMKIDENNGFIEWKPKGNQMGNNTVVIGVSDGNLTYEQEFTLIVFASEQDEQHEQQEQRAVSAQSSSGSSSSGSISRGISSSSSSLSGRGSAKFMSAPEVVQDYKTSIVGIESNSLNLVLKVEELGERPKDADRISKRAYKYLRIENLNQTDAKGMKEAVINFSVDLYWLNQTGIKYDDIVLSRHTPQGWQDLATENTSKDDKYVYYIARTPGFSYFAISVKDGVDVKSIVRPQISRIEAPFRILGIVYKLLKPNHAPQGTKISFENMNTSESIVTETGIGPYSGAYYVLLYGNADDLIRVNISGKSISDKEFFMKLKDADIDFVMYAPNQFLIFILPIFVVLAAVLAAVLVAIMARFKYKGR